METEPQDSTEEDSDDGYLKRTQSVPRIIRRIVGVE